MQRICCLSDWSFLSMSCHFWQGLDCVLMKKISRMTTLGDIESEDGSVAFTSSRLPSSILNAGFRHCGVSHILPLSIWVSSGLSSFFQPPTTCIVSKLPLSVNECVNVCPWCPATSVQSNMDSRFTFSVPWIGYGATVTLTRRHPLLKMNEFIRLHELCL